MLYSDAHAIVDDEITPLSIEQRDGAPAACHLNIVVGPSGSIAGVVKSSDGGPIDGWVSADTVTPDNRPGKTAASTALTSGVVFRLDHLNPGRYFVQFTNRVGFVQGTSQIIDLRKGERRAGVVLVAR